MFRDSAGPGFQQNNSAADLALAFQKIRGTLDLAPAALRTPELSRPAVATMVDNLKLLRLETQIEVQNIDTLRWLRSIEANTRKWPKMPWVIYCCPPYRLWKEESQRLLAGVAELYAAAPAGSWLVCETEQDFDMAKELPDIDWDIRKYNPAYVAVAHKPGEPIKPDN